MSFDTNENKLRLVALKRKYRSKRLAVSIAHFFFNNDDMQGHTVIPDDELG